MATELSSTKVAGGTLRRVKHASAATATDMVFAIFTPAATVEPEGGWPVIYWLSGLTCDDTNFSTSRTRSRASRKRTRPSTSSRAVSASGAS